MLLRCTIAILATGLLLPAGVAIGTGSWAASVLGGSIALLTALLGLFLVHRFLDEEAEDGGMQGVFGAVVATMLARLVLLAGGLIVAAKVLDLSALVFVGAFFPVYAVSQVLEIRYIHRARPTPAAA